jgi:hypothetical protein
MELESMVQHAEHIGGLMLQTQGEHPEERRELLELFGFVLLHNGEVLLLTCGFVERISNVAERDCGQLDEMPEDRKGVMAVCYRSSENELENEGWPGCANGCISQRTIGEQHDKRIHPCLSGYS